MPTKQVVALSAEQRDECEQLIRAGIASVRSIRHAQVLLKTDAGPGGPAWTDRAIAEAFSVSTVTVATIRQTMCREGLKAALSHYRIGQREYRPKLDGHAEAHLIALACSQPPVGHLRWSLRLLSARMVELGYIDSLSHDTVQRTLKKTSCSPGAPSASASRREKAPPS